MFSETSARECVSTQDVLRRYSPHSPLASLWTNARGGALTSAKKLVVSCHSPCGKCTAKPDLVKKLPAAFTSSEDYSEAFTLLSEG